MQSLTIATKEKSFSKEVFAATMLHSVTTITSEKSFTEEVVEATASNHSVPTAVVNGTEFQSSAPAAVPPELDKFISKLDNFSTILFDKSKFRPVVVGNIEAIEDSMKKEKVHYLEIYHCCNN